MRELREPRLAVDIESAERSKNLDILRSLAALSVVATHAYGLGVPTGAAVDLGFAKRALIGSSGVWLFFALSGYLITGPFFRSLMTGGPLPGFREYATRRVARIFPAYLVAFAVVVMFGLPRGVPTEWWQYPLHSALLQNLVRGEEQAMLNVAWTLTIEVLFYLFVPIAAWLVRKAYRGPIAAPALITGICALWALSILWTYMAGEIGVHPVTVVWLRFLFPSMLSMFCPGMIIAVAVVEWRQRGVPPRWFEWICSHRPLALAGVVGFFALGVLGIDRLVQQQVYNFSRQAFAVSFGLVVMLALTRPDVRGALGRTFAWLGIISYGIYLWHAVIRQIIFRHGIDGWVPMPHLGAGAFFVHVAYLVALTIPVAWLSWILIERPAIHWAKRNIARHQPRSTPVATPTAET